MRRKVFQPNANIPMVRETHRRLALQLRMAGESLIAAPSIDTYNQLSKMLAAMNRAGMAGIAIDRATTTMNQICDRFERVGRIGVSESESATLRTALADIDTFLPAIPVNKIERAVAEVETFFALTDI